MEFEWDEIKRQVNIEKHKFDLVEGSLLFDGRKVYSYPSFRGAEKRYVTVGMVEDNIVAVVWVERCLSIRLISLRRARDAEKRIYHTSFS